MKHLFRRLFKMRPSTKEKEHRARLTGKLKAHFFRPRLEELEDRTAPAVTGTTGGSLPFTDMQPSLALNYIIATSGIFPSFDEEISTSDSDGAPFIGEVRLFAGNFVPGGYALAAGQLLTISGNAALFSLLGTRYGGDGRTNFALPDLRGRAIVDVGFGPDLSDYELGEMVGEENNTLLTSNLPTHTHTIPGGTTGTTGSGIPFSNLQPSLGVDVGIATEGIYPNLGEVRFFAHSHFDETDGDVIDIASNGPLFSLLGTTYGGNGTTNFQLPDFRGRLIMGAGQGAGLSNYTIGQQTGSENITLSASNLPAHDHTTPGANTGMTGSASPTSFSDLQPSLSVSYYVRTQGVFPSQGGGGASDIYLGEVRAFATKSGSRPSSEWTLADGRLLTIAGNTALFSILGTFYGGNGTTHFGLPDLRGRVPIGKGQGDGLTNYTIAQTVGAESITLNVTRMAAHNHTIPDITTDVSLSGGNLVITDVVGGNSDDSLTISRNGANIRIFDPNNLLIPGSGTTLVNANTVEVPVTSITGNIQVNTLAGIDTITIGTGNLDDFPVGIVVNGGGQAGDAVTLNDSTNVFGDTYTLTSAALNRPFFGGLTYSGITALNLNAQPVNNIININSTTSGVTTTMNGGDGVDTINVGDGNLDSLSGALTVNGGGQAGDTVNVNDSTAPYNDPYTLTSTALTRAIFGGLTYSGITALNMTAETGPNTINIDSTASGVATSVNGGGGVDTINVGAGNLDNFPGALTVNGGGQAGDTVNVNDSTAQFDDTYTLTSTTLTRPFFAGLTYGGITALSLTGETASNVVNVTSFNSANLSINTGGGTADVVNINGAIAVTGGVNITTVNVNSTAAGTISTASGLNVNNSGTASTLAGSMGGAGGLNKFGVGILTLTGTNNYAGTTAVNGGVLLVNGNNSAATGPVTVNNVGTLGGVGTVGGAVTVNSSARITGGTDGTVGTLTMPSLNFNGGTYRADIVGNNSDKLVVSGAVNLNAGSAGLFNLAASGSTIDGTVFTLIDKTSAGAITNPPFTGVAQGSTTTVDNKSATYSYTAGTGGNDFTLSVALTAPLVTSLGVNVVGITDADWDSNEATITTLSSHGLAVGESITIAGMSVTGYNGPFTVATVLDSSKFTYAVVGPLADNASGGTVSGASSSIQRSRTNSLVVTFNTAINTTHLLSSVGAFTLTQENGNFPQPAALTYNGQNGALGGGINVTVLSSTQVVLTFESGFAGVEFGSLSDGSWKLVVDNAAMKSGGGVTMAADYVNASSITRLYGDVDGDGVVDINDLTPFGTTFGSAFGDDNFLAAFDIDESGTIDINDLTEFGGRFGLSL